MFNNWNKTLHNNWNSIYLLIFWIENIDGVLFEIVLQIKHWHLTIETKKIVLKYFILQLQFLYFVEYFIQNNCKTI